MLTVKGTPNQGLFGATLGFFFGFAAVALFGPTAERFKDLMQLSPMQVGWLVAMPALSGSLLRIPFAACVDADGGRRPFIVLLLLSLTGMAGLTALILLRYPSGLGPEHYPLVLALGVLCGCGIATFSPGAGQVSYWFPQSRQGIALGVYAGVGNLAPGLFSLILPVALAHWDLDGAYVAWLAFLALGVWIYMLTARNAWYFQLRRGRQDAAALRRARELGQELFPAGSAIESLKRSARVWKTWLLVAVYFTTFGGFIALTAWLPVYWREVFAVSGQTAGMLTAMYSIGASLFRVAGGKLADQIRGERAAVLGLALTAFGAAVLTLSPAFVMCVAAILTLACGMGIANAAVFKLVPQEIPEAVGGAAGWVGGLGAFGGFAIPPLMSGFVARHGLAGYAHGFAIFVALSLAALLLAGFALRGRAASRVHLT